MKTTISLALAITTLSLSAPLAQAADGDERIVRARIINIDPDVSSSIAGLDVDSQVTADVSMSYFFMPNWGVDVSLTTAEHDVTLGGANIGSTRIWPVNVTGLYRFSMMGMVQPYVGAGLNYTRFTSVDILGGAVDLDKNSFGPVIQAGLDWPINDQWSLNADIKWIWVETDVSGAASGSLDIDPLVYGVGIGWRF